MTVFLFVAYVISVSLVLVSPESTLPAESGHSLGQRLATLLGTSTAGFALLLLTSGLMSVLFAVSKIGFAILGIIGSLYVCYRGLVSTAAALLPQPASQQSMLSACSFGTGFTATLKNQRMASYFVSFLPIFVTHGGHFFHNMMVLVVVWIVLDLVLRLIYNGMARQAISKRRRPHLLLSIGIVFVLVALYGFTHYISFLIEP